MVANGDILEFTLGSYYASLSNSGLNVFQYEVVTDAPFGIGVYGQEIADQIYEQVTAQLVNCVSNLVNFNAMSMKNLTNPIELWSGGPTDAVNGVVTGDCLPPYAAWAFKYNRTNGLTRNGAKRFWGVPESMQINGEATLAAVVELVSLASNLGAGFTVTTPEAGVVDFQLYPSIVRKDETGEIIANQRVTSVQYRQLSTQNTRKFGRGM